MTIAAVEDPRKSISKACNLWDKEHNASYYQDIFIDAIRLGVVTKKLKKCWTYELKPRFLGSLGFPSNQNQDKTPIISINSQKTNLPNLLFNSTKICCSCPNYHHIYIKLYLCRTAKFESHYKKLFTTTSVLVVPSLVLQKANERRVNQEGILKKRANFERLEKKNVYHYSLTLLRHQNYYQEYHYNV